ncbi:MAG: hypothetical protein Q8O21_00895 [bacterium]|nr:hypothetical protein [bacterium]
MNKQNINSLEKAVIEKYQKKDGRKKVKMKISGASVKKLQKIIKEK